MKFCENCGGQINESDMFCENCGAVIKAEGTVVPNNTMPNSSMPNNAMRNHAMPNSTRCAQGEAMPEETKFYVSLIVGLSIDWRCGTSGNHCRSYSIAGKWRRKADERCRKLL